MGATFSFFRFNRFPDCPSGDGKSLLSRGDRELFGDPAKTKITLTSSSVYGGFEQYHVYHESLRHARGRLYSGQEFEEYYQRNEFETFVDRDSGTLVCATAKRLARHLVDHLNKTSPSSFNIDYMELDFTTLRPRIQQISGVWVSQMSQPFLDCMAMYGQNVDKSDMYKLAESLGIASSMLITHRYKEQTYPVIISRDYLVAFPSPEPRELCFELIGDLQNNLFKDAISTVDSPFNKRAKRQKNKA